MGVDRFDPLLVAPDVAAAVALDDLGHPLLGGLQADLGLDVVAHRLKARQALLLVGPGLVQRPRRELVQLLGGDMAGAGHRDVVEVPGHRSGGRVPAGVPHPLGHGRVSPFSVTVRVTVS
ncbi:hypothetical protein [Streptomyces sp. NPDC001292]|uniref:hypothetical protein n=1 Tax=Streptomyces sp. NPDC001292 TaxID=3364558 RepID=UPI0036A1192E